MKPPLLILATTNRGKSREFRELLADLPVILKDLAEFPELPPLTEDGDTFAANARGKASSAAERLREWVLADDTGLEVETLGGLPGVRSARYAGPTATAGENRSLLLANLRDTPLSSRGARFVCSLALCDPNGRIVAESVGACRGRILFEPAGSGGFGYDSLFEIVEYHRTLAEIGEAAASCLTHRARAVAAIRGSLIESCARADRGRH